MTLSDAKDIGAIIVQLLTVVVIPYIAFVTRRVEKNTNSLTQQLVTKTEISSEQLGKEKEQAAQEGREKQWREDGP